jgi:hypothetical protein
MREGGGKKIDENMRKEISVENDGMKNINKKEKKEEIIVLMKDGEKKVGEVRKKKIKEKVKELNLNNEEDILRLDMGDDEEMGFMKRM